MILIEKWPRSVFKGRIIISFIYNIVCKFCELLQVIVYMWLLWGARFFLRFTLKMSNDLKRHNHHKNIKKSVIFFLLFNMTIWCKNVQTLELQTFSNFCAAHLAVKRDIESKFPYFLFWTCGIVKFITVDSGDELLNWATVKVTNQDV